MTALDKLLGELEAEGCGPRTRALVAIIRRQQVALKFYEVREPPKSMIGAVAGGALEDVESLAKGVVGE